MTVALITGTDASPGEYEYLAAELSRDCVQVLRAAGRSSPATAAAQRGSWCCQSPQVTAAIMNRLPGLALIATRSPARPPTSSTGPASRCGDLGRSIGRRREPWTAEGHHTVSGLTRRYFRVCERGPRYGTGP